MSQSLGLLEVAGLLSAITVADAMVKTANVRLLAVEEARGNGWMTVKIEGSVDAVNAAIDAGATIAKGMDVLISKKVIARPEESVFRMFGLRKVEENAEHKASTEADVIVQNVDKEDLKNVQVVETIQEIAVDQVVEEASVVHDEVVGEEVKADEDLVQVEEVPETLTEEVQEIQASEVPEAQTEEALRVTCNLCHDPRCSRKKGEFKTSCLHYQIEKLGLKKGEG